jgi:hypothetical protein
MPFVECPECGQLTLIPATSTRTPSDKESREAPIAAAMATMEIDVVEMPVKPRKGPPSLRKLYDGLDLGKRRKLQDALSYSLVSLTFIAGAISILVYAEGDSKGFAIVCFGVLVIGCIYIVRCLYFLAITPRSITKSAFRDRNYWYSFFFIHDKAPEDYCREIEGNNGAKDLQISRQEDKNSPRVPTRDGEILLAFFVMIATLLFSILVLAPKIVLIGHYGWAKVQQEHLYFLAMPKGHPWPVSNGDVLDIGFGHYVVTVICWFGLFFPLYLMLRLLLPKRKKPR